MSFFKPTAPQAYLPQRPSGPQVSTERVVRAGIPDRMAEERARVARFREEQERLAAAMDQNDQIEVEGEILNPRGRPIGVENRAAKNNRKGLSAHQVVDRKPRGCLFRLGHGYFDLDGFWCVANHLGAVTVTRGTGKEMMARMSKDQRRILEAARLAARRNGLR